MKKFIVIIALAMGLNAQIPEQYKSLSITLYNYIYNNESELAMQVLDDMLIVSVALKDKDMQYRIANTMSALALTSNQTTMLDKAYRDMQNTPLSKRDTKYYWLMTKLSQKLTNTIFPANLYHLTMCNMALENNQTKYLKKCGNQYYFLSNFFQNIEKKGTIK
jgi:hypothetical protein